MIIVFTMVIRMVRYHHTFNQRITWGLTCHHFRYISAYCGRTEPVTPIFLFLYDLNSINCTSRRFFGKKSWLEVIEKISFLTWWRPQILIGLLLNHEIRYLSSLQQNNRSHNCKLKGNTYSRPKKVTFLQNWANF